MNFEIKLTKEQLDVVFAALVELPFKVSQPLIQVISQQAQAQQAQARQPVTPDLPKPHAVND